jgi:hypothetical protein
VHPGIGFGTYPGLITDGTTNHWIANMGVDWKYDFSEHWSLLVGMDFQYRLTNGYYITQGVDGPENRPFTSRNYIIKVPVLFEYHARWFYIAVGPYLLREIGDLFSGNSRELATIGPTVEVGGRIKLSEKSHLRIGWQSSIGIELRKRTNYYYNNTTTSLGIGRIEANSLLQIGYEYHF